MRSDLTSMEALSRHLDERAPTGDGRAALRRRPTVTTAPSPGASSDGARLDDALLDGARRARRPRGLGDTLEARRSSLHYSTRPTPTLPVLALAQDALRRDQHAWPTAGGVPLEALVLSFRSSDLPPGAWLVRPDEVTRVRGTEDLPDLDELGVQREFSTGAGMVVVCADLDAADSWAGPHGYRVTTVRASMVTYDVHLGCQADGLVGTVFGGLVPASLRGPLDVDGVCRAPLLATTWAHDPAQDEPTD